MLSKNRIRLLAAIAVAAVVPSASALQIILNPDAGLAANPAALTAFQAAANMWQNAFTDNVVVTINAGLSSTAFSNPNIIGQTQSTQYTYGTFDQARALLVNDAADEPSDAIVASLPTLAQLSHTGYSNVAFNNTMVFTQANLRALGVTGFGTTADATITFNSNFTFDYDRTNGQTPNTEDFETVAEHEIGHALGFVSGVDSQSAAGGFYTKPLDLFRFQTAGLPTTAAQFTNNVREFRQGAAATFSDTVHNYAMSTAGPDRANANSPSYTYQASHWRADEITGQFIGLMDPSIAFGQAYDYTAADLRAFDLIGWDLRNPQAVPEPATFAALGLGALAVLRRRKKA